MNWEPIPRIAREIPFGYDVDEEEDTILVPIPLELEALEKAKKYVRSGHSLRDVRDWLVNVTGREISREGLRKRIKSDRERRRKVAGLKAWHEREKKARERAEKAAQRLGMSS